MEFWRYYRIVRRRRWLIIIGMLVCVGVVAINTSLTKPQWMGRTTVMESKGMSQDSVPLFPEQYMQLDVQLRLSNLGNIATSQKVMNNAAATLVDLGLKFSPEEILGHTAVEPVRDTNILAIEVTLPDREQAKIAADVIAAEFKKVYGELNNSSVSQSREFIEGQLDTTKRAMNKAQDALRRYKEKHKVIMLDQQSMSVIQRISEAKVNQNQAAIGLASAHARVGTLEQELKGMDDMEISSRQVSRNPLWERLSEQLLDLENKKVALLGGLNKPGKGLNHPDVQAIQRQIDDTKVQMAKEQQDYEASTVKSKSPVHQDSLSRWVQAKVDEAGADAQRQAASTVLDKTQTELANLPEEEAKLASLQADVKAASDTYSLMRAKLDEARIREQQVRNEAALKTVDPAYVVPVDQRRATKLMLALILSPILGIGAAFILHYTDNTVRTASDMERLVHLPVLSLIPASKGHSLVRQTCPEIVDVAYQMLTSNLWIANQNSGANSIVVVSAEPDVGRSIVASNLAASLAREGAKVILVDADFRQPAQHLIFAADNKVGLSNVLSGAATFEDVLVPTRVQGLLLVPTGPVPDNAVKLLRSQEMKAFVDQISELADFVIYDTPAGVAFPDPVLVAAQVGNAIMVHSAGRVSRGSEPEFSARLESVGVKQLGTVLNRVRLEDSSSYFHYYRSYQGTSVAQLPGGKKAISS